jgi:hypothetical protein
MSVQHRVNRLSRGRARFARHSWRRLVILAAALALTIAGAAPQAEASKASSARAAEAVEVGFAVGLLPANVAEMREAILAAALSGNLQELMIPVQWNELPPDFGAKPVKETLEAWRKASHDGSGREMLALIANILTAPYAVRRQGADIENAKIFIWPAIAEVPLDKLTPPLEVSLLRLVGVDEARRMKKAGHYDGYGVAVGADGTWHAFKRVRKPQTPKQD